MTCMNHSFMLNPLRTCQVIKCFLEINEIVEQIPLALQMFLDEDLTFEDLFVFHLTLKHAALLTVVLQSCISDGGA